MKLTILLLLGVVCVVTAKYLPNEWDNSEQLLGRYKRSDSNESDGSSENENDSNNDDSDIQNRKEKEEQSERIAKMEKMRQKLLEKQEKERIKQEEVQRKLEEKIAKELKKEEEKRQKEKRKQEEKLEKQRKKLEEEQKKIQEKIIENERKRQERIQKELEEKEKNNRKIMESSESYADDSIKELLKIQIYSKYGINGASTGLEKEKAFNRYLQEELGLDANSTESEQRKAILDNVQNRLLNASEINALQNQLIEYIKYAGVQKIRGKIENDIEKLQNKTETLNNVNSTWVPSAKQYIAEQVSFLETIKQILPNVLPSWFSGSQLQNNLTINPGIDNQNINNSLKTSHNVNNLTREGSSLDITTTKVSDNFSSVSLSNPDLGEVSKGTQHNPVSINEVTPKLANTPIEISNNGTSTIFGSSGVTEPSYFESESGQNILTTNGNFLHVDSNIPSRDETPNVTNEVVSSTFKNSLDVVNKTFNVFSNDSNILNIASVDITTEFSQNSMVDIATSLNYVDGVKPSSLLPSPQSTTENLLPGNNNKSFDSSQTNSSHLAEGNRSLVSESNNKPSDNQNIDRPNNINNLSTIFVDVTTEKVSVLISDTISSFNSSGDANISSVLSSPDLRNETSSLLSKINNESYNGKYVNGSSNDSSVSKLLSVDATTEFVSNLIANTILSVNSAVDPVFVSVKNNETFDNKNGDGSNISNISNIISALPTTEKVLVPIIDSNSSVDFAGEDNSSSLLSIPSLTINESYDGFNSLSNNSSVSSSLPVGTTTEFIPNLIFSTVLSANSLSNTSFPSSSPDVIKVIPPLISVNNNVAFHNPSIDGSNILNIVPVVATTESTSNSIIDIALSENTTNNNSTTVSVSGNNREFLNDQNVTDSSNNVSKVVEVTTDYVLNPIETITVMNSAVNANSPSSSPNLSLTKDTPTVGSEINRESANNILEQVIVSVSDIFGIKNDVQRNVSNKISNNNTNVNSVGLQTILPLIPSTNEGIDATNETISPNQSAVDNGGIFNTEEQVIFNEVTSLSTEQSVVTGITRQDVLTSENILNNSEAPLINTVPEEPGVVIIDVVKQ